MKKIICLKKSSLSLLILLFLICISIIGYLKLTVGINREPNTLKTKAEVAKSTNLIVNGVKAKPNEFPSYVRIYSFPIMGFATSCGGVLISDEYVLTAYHCVEYLRMFPTGRIEILIGVDDFVEDDTKVLGHYYYNIPFKDEEALNKIISYPAMEEIKDENNPSYKLWYNPDLALIRLPDRSPKNIPLYSLPPEISKNRQDKILALKDGMRMTAIGVGDTGEPKSSEDKNSYSSYYLNKVYMILNNSLDLFDKAYMGTHLLRFESYKNGGNVCNGDSGGPMLGTLWKIPYIVGIASKSKGCMDNAKKNESYFVSIEDFVPWIVDITGIKPGNGTINERTKKESYKPQVELGNICITLKNEVECQTYYAICKWINKWNDVGCYAK